MPPLANILKCNSVSLPLPPPIPIVHHLTPPHPPPLFLPTPPLPPPDLLFAVGFRNTITFLILCGRPSLSGDRTLSSPYLCGHRAQHIIHTIYNYTYTIIMHIHNIYIHVYISVMCRELGKVKIPHFKN